ncbi:MAG TPA: NADH-quinone oxidoreductase subunit M [Armatimonadota bacterium]|jgi:NADH-quinone oxidoreductase subunit M
METWPLLSILIFLPALGGILCLALDEDEETGIRGMALAVALLNFAVSVALWVGFRVGVPGFQFVEDHSWISSIGARYHLGVDGVSLLLVVLTTLLTVVAVLASAAITERLKAYMAFLLFLETGMIGVFVAMDLFLFYVFWEAMLIPMYFLIGIWGGPRRIYASVKFVIYTMVGSLLMLVAILALYGYYRSYVGAASFDMRDLQTLVLPYRTQMWLFMAFFLAFAIKVPMFPFHTWLPDAHVEAPTAGSIILAGVLLKMGIYGFYRIAMPFFPEVTRAWIPAILALSAVAIIYGAAVALMQKDIKKLVAYSSVSHLGFATLGLFALNVQGVSGSVMQMINHGISTGALFLLVGMIYDRRHTRRIEDFGGLWTSMPAYGSLFLITTLSSIGLPLLNGFTGEFPVLLGAFRLSPLWASISSTGVILGACYMLWMFQRVFQGEMTHEENKVLPGLTRSEWAAVLPLILLMFAIGLYPRALTDRIQPSVATMIGQVTRRSGPSYAVLPHPPQEPAPAEDEHAHAPAEPTPSEVNP